MSEQLRAPEHFSPTPERPAAERSERTETRQPDNPESNRFDLDKLQQSIERHSASRQEVTVEATRPSDDSDHSFAAHKQIRRNAYKQTMQRVQAKLPAAERAFSKFAHRPTVEAVSNTAATTIARPSGVLGGATVALLGSTVLLYMSRSYGFTYNYFAFFLLAMIGFGLGLLVELVARRFRRK